MPDCRLRLRFEDGAEGDIDFPAPFEGIFAPLRDPKVFEAVQVNAELGTIVWPNGADFDPDVLYSLVTGRMLKLREPVG